MHKLNHKKAFTIVELLVVIVVIAIIAAVSIVMYGGIQNRAIETTLKSDLRSAATQINADKALTEKYPLTKSAVNEGKGLYASGGVLLQYTSDGTSYCLSAMSDKESINSFRIDNSGSIQDGTCPGHYTAATMPPSDCPTGFIPVPGYAPLGTRGFCVMKYEAKNVGGVATSQAAGSPWLRNSSLGRAAASAACTGCRPMNELDWMTIAADVIRVPANWTGGAVGSGVLYAGHSDNSPSSARPASEDDNNGYYNTSNTHPSNQRRTFYMSNGEVIWDMAGNAMEYTQGRDPSFKDSPHGSSGATYATRNYSEITGWGALPNTSRPSVIGADAWLTGFGIGLITSGSTAPNGWAIQRGGASFPVGHAGVLSVTLAGNDVDGTAAFRAVRP